MELLIWILTDGAKCNCNELVDLLQSKSSLQVNLQSPKTYLYTFHTQNLLDFLFPFHATLGFSLPLVSSFFLHANPQPCPSLPVEEQPVAISQKAAGNHLCSSPSLVPNLLISSFLTLFHVKPTFLNQFPQASIIYIGE
ncbi:hypothetical protein SLEP1_g18239 [Rubroshorea leprosula]|uniref:LAGLIDADG homing endonuclease n=1 Tax=Rubroshorea leprosula TaxID=152421 RepID=A0AAV5J8L5_9ROSI|nr:hypothetical protein SLEP1_g18239 [Rubroshorea leprosula]